MHSTSPDIEASAVISVDGLALASALPMNAEEDRVAAMSAALLSLGERISTELRRGVLDQVYVRGNAGYVILRSVGGNAVLTVLASPESKLGLLFMDMKRTAKELTQLL